MFVCMLLASGMLALEREETRPATAAPRPRVARGRCSARRRCSRPPARSSSASRCSPASASSSAATGVASARGCSRWPGGAVAFARSAWRIGAVGRDVRAASLLALMVSLPLVFLALVPSGAVVERAVRRRSASSRRSSRSRPRSRRSTRRVNGSSPSLAASILHLLVLAVLFGARRPGRPAPPRLASPPETRARTGPAAPARPGRREYPRGRWPFPTPACGGCAHGRAARSRARDRAQPAAVHLADVRRLDRGPRADRGDARASSRLSIGEAVAEAGELAALGIPAVILFGIPGQKDDEGSGAWDEEGVVQLATRAIKPAHPELLVITDVCLCEYTSHGHCGVLRAGRRGRQRRVARAARAHRRRARPAPAPTSSRRAT